MPILDCPTEAPVAGPVRTATDGAHGLTPGAAVQNARRDAIEEADGEVIDAIDDDYECRSGCELSMGPQTIVGVPRQNGPPKRAWWTFWIAYWAVVTATVTRSVACHKE